jgi:hypothetical protein
MLQNDVCDGGVAYRHLAAVKSRWERGRGTHVFMAGEAEVQRV